MGPLIECPGCRRHVRVEDGRCPFCARPSTTSAPVRVLALMLPLTLMACTGGEDKPDPAAKPAADGKTTPAKPEAEAEAGAEPEQPSTPADDGAQADGAEAASPDRELATKYGGPPKPNPMDIDTLVVPEGSDVVEPETSKPETKAEERPARKYGAPPRPKDPKKPKK